MDTGLYRIESTGLAKLSGLAKLPGLSDTFSGWSAAFKYLKPIAFWLAVLIGGLGAWILLPGNSGNIAESEPVRLAAAAATEPAESPVEDGGKNGVSVNTMTTPADVTVPAEAAPVDGLKISSQSWRRGGLGSNALVTFTVRNDNDYAVKDIEISCAFARRDGTHMTDRTRTIHDTVNMKSRRTFARLHIGFVNINAGQAKCSLVAARRA
jgi:hypothetical protein